MSATGNVRSSQLRHALRTPLNQISGYSDMLLEDLHRGVPGAVRDLIVSIRDNGRTILELLQKELPPDSPEITPADLQCLRATMQPLLDAIVASVGALVASGAGKDAGLNMTDVMRIGAAATELSEFASGARHLRPAAEPLDRASGMSETAISGHVLVVDDNAGNRDLLARILERHGLIALSAADGETALLHIAQQPLDLILLDLMMPGMDGIEVLDRIKSDPLRRELPVIMLSALDETSRVIQCLERGAEDYVIKPFDPVLLLARLRSTLERSRLRAAEITRARELESAYGKLRENEQRLQESEERLRLATEAAEVGIWYYHPHQKRAVMTPGCKRLFCIDGDEESVRWSELSQHIHPDDREFVLAAVDSAVARVAEYDVEFRVVRGDRSIRWLSSRGLAQTGGEERQVRLAGVALDISRRKQAEEAVLQAHKLESIGLLAGGIAHDFNNLLTGIIGSASFVIDNLADGDPNAEMLRNVVDAGERAADLTRQLLAYSGKGKFSVQRLDLSKLVNDISVLLRASISRAVTVERNLEEGLPKIEGDASQIQQIVMNLVINGAEAITGEGVVRLSTGVAQLGPGARETFVLGEEIPPGRYVYLEVSDTGSGMDPEILGKIFEPFFTTKFTGRGMGLAAVFGIVRGHDGALEVRTAPGAGSTFRVYLPPVPGEKLERDPPSGKQKQKVLFADDEGIVRLMGKTALERAGYEVITADTGEDAFRVLQDVRDIAVVVLDLTMPGWTGFDTYRRLKQFSPNVHILISSGYNAEEVRERYPNAEIGPMLQKPYSASLLVARVQEILRRSPSKAN